MQMLIGFTRWGAHSRNLANTIEPSECGSDAALCHITLTTCFHFCHIFIIVAAFIVVIINGEI